jgi:bifunctional DNA-binding transcriptional regulator/antitoxin component of YhaV-PrlF toxin-antitoxin module
MKTYTVETFADENGDIILPLPLEVLEELGWDEGTTLEWKDNGNGSFSLKKKETMLERIKSWLNWRGKSSYSAIKINSMTKEEVAAEEAKDLGSAFIEPLNPKVVSEEAINVTTAAPKKAAKKKAVAKKVPAKKKATKKSKKDK